MDLMYISYIVSQMPGICFSVYIILFSIGITCVQRTCIYFYVFAFTSTFIRIATTVHIHWVSVVRKINSHSIDFYFVFRLVNIWGNSYWFWSRISCCSQSGVYCAFGLAWFYANRCAHTENTPYIAFHCCVCVCAPYRERFEACNW